MVAGVAAAFCPRSSRSLHVEGHWRGDAEEPWHGRRHAVRLLSVLGRVKPGPGRRTCKQGVDAHAGDIDGRKETQRDDVPRRPHTPGAERSKQSTHPHVARFPARHEDSRDKRPEAPEGGREDEVLNVSGNQPTLHEDGGKLEQPRYAEGSHEERDGSSWDPCFAAALGRGPFKHRSVACTERGRFPRKIDPCTHLSRRCEAPTTA
jgi:hypothetical protein